MTSASLPAPALLLLLPPLLFNCRKARLLAFHVPHYRQSVSQNNKPSSKSSCRGLNRTLTRLHSAWPGPSYYIRHIQHSIHLDSSPKTELSTDYCYVVNTLIKMYYAFIKKSQRFSSAAELAFLNWNPHNSKSLTHISEARRTTCVTFPSAVLKWVGNWRQDPLLIFHVQRPQRIQCVHKKSNTTEFPGNSN